jgi:hypothetical protein
MTIGTPSFANVFHAPRPSGGDDKAALQAVIDAAIAAGGGIVELAAGTYRVDPLGTGLGLLVDGDFVRLRGQGEATTINFRSSTATIPFCGIAPKRYNTCTAPYTAAPLWVTDMRLTCDDSTNVNCYDLIGICHCPWAMVQNVGFEQGYYHAFEVNLSKNVLVDGCYVYGTGNFRACIWEFDSGGAAGQMTMGGSHSTSTPVENVTISGFVQRVPRTDLTISTGGYDFGLLSHTNAAGVYRNIIIEKCVMIPHNNATIPSGNTASVIGFDTAAYPLSVDGLTIRDNVWVDSGGLSGSHILLDLAAPSTATRNIRNVEVSGNIFLSPHAYAIRAGSLNNATAPRTSIADSDVRSHDNIRIFNNSVSVRLNGNANSARAIRSFWIGAARGVNVSGNTVAWPDVANGSGWGTSTVATASYAFFVDHVQNLVFDQNTVEITRPQTGGTAGLWCQVYAFVFAAGAFEIQSVLNGQWQVTGNKAIGNGNIGVNLACGFLSLYTSGTTGLPQWTAANKLMPRIDGMWSGNVSIQTGTGTYTHTLQGTYPTYFVCAGTVTNTPLDEASLAALGAHDWQPGADTIGTVCTVPAGATMAPGWKLCDGALVTALPWLQETNWNQRLGLSATLNIPNTANTYIRLSGQ